jgi:hypothetical protein
MMKSAVVMREARGAIEFWTGRNWSEEYPDAMLLTPTQAKSVARELNHDYRSTNVEAWNSWGTADQALLYASPSVAGYFRMGNPPTRA